MRLLLAAAVAASVLPVAPAAAIDPLCEILGNVVSELGCDGDPVDLLPDVDVPDAATSAFALYCAVTGTLPGTSESGFGSCDVSGTFASTWPTTWTGGAAATLRYGSVGAASLAQSSGWFTVSVPDFDWAVTGTYSRIGSTWTFAGTQRDTSLPATYQGPFVAVGEGLPAIQGYPLVVGAV